MRSPSRINAATAVVFVAVAAVALQSGCGPQHPVRDAVLTLPDWHRIESVAREAIATRLTDAERRNLSVDRIEYLWHLSPEGGAPDEGYFVEYHGRGTTRTNETLGEVVHRYERAGVEIRPDGMVEKGAVSKGWFELLASPGRPLRHGWTEGDPVWGKSFYPRGPQTLRIEPKATTVGELAVKVAASVSHVSPKAPQVQEISCVLVCNGVDTSRHPVFAVVLRLSDVRRQQAPRIQVSSGELMVELDEFGEYVTGSLRASGAPSTAEGLPAAGGP